MRRAFRFPPGILLLSFLLVIMFFGLVMFKFWSIMLTGADGEW